MGEFWNQVGIELKNLANFLHIEEVKEEHHSIPYAPKGRITQVLKGKPKEEPTILRSHLFSRHRTERSSNERTFNEWKIVNRVESPVMVTQNDIFGRPYRRRNVEGMV